jgi:cobalt-zinc-cadmium efflux system protein
MAHEHHHHAHENPGHGRAFAVGIALNLGFVAIESVYGVLAHSMALLADAGHNLSDVLALALAWGASILGRRVPSRRFTYGLGSTTILAALVNAMLLMLVVGGIAVEAVQRLLNPVPVATVTVIWVALGGIVINTATALLFLRGREHDLNVRGAFLHMAADAAVSLGVVLAGVAILYTGGTWGLLRDSANLALHAVPPRIDTAQIRGYFSGLSGVAEFHDLHIWGMSTTETALTVHLVMPDGHPSDRFIAEVADELHERFGIGHATIQVETGDALHPCVLAPDHVV